MSVGEGTSGPESGDHRQHSRLDSWLQRGAVLRALFDDAPRGIIITRVDGKILGDAGLPGRGAREPALQ